MSYRRDYILQLIEEFFNALKRILNLKSDNDFEGALNLINQTSQKFLNLDLEELVQNEENFNSIFEKTELSFDQIEMLAELIAVKAGINYENANLFSAVNLFDKALRLFEYRQSHTKDFSIDRANKIDEIKLTIIKIKNLNL